MSYNDWKDAQIDEMVAADWHPGDDDEWLMRDDEPDKCPYCGHGLDEIDALLICGNCRVHFSDRNDVARERPASPAEGWAQ
jgi:hypothetical protein